MTAPRVGLTTTGDRSLALVADVTALGLDPVLLPCIELVAASDEVVSRARTESARSGWLLLTSPRTVQRLWPEGGMPAAKVAAVGQATAEAVRTAGGTVSIVGDGGTREVVDRINHVLGRQSIFFPHAAGADRSTIDMLERAGATVKALVVYETRPTPPGPDPVDAVIFGSPSAVTGWFLARGLDGVVVGVIGDTTASALAEHGRLFDVKPSSPSFGELIRLIAGHLRDRSTI